MKQSGSRSSVSGETRRNFIKKTATAFVAGGDILKGYAYDPTEVSGITIVADTRDLHLQQPPVRWALGELQNVLKARGIPSHIQVETGQASSLNGSILIAHRASGLARRILDRAGVSIPDASETLGLVRSSNGDRNELLVCGSDPRGLVYAILEVADRVTHASDPLGALRGIDRIVQQPSNPIRSVTRSFTSEAEDKPWFYDKPFWQQYLTMLIAQRFNRFSLAVGLGYNAPRQVRDSYFYFPYPFLISVPGYEVSVRVLTREERERNLATLRWIAEEATARGLHFQLALWTHAYQFIDSPNVNYTITGLTPENHAAYCSDAVHMLLEECPVINGVTVRAHSESGIAEGSYEFWEKLFEGIARCKRPIEIDIHSKGIEHKLLDLALRTGLSVNVSPKYWAEHMGLPYHQAAIRDLEKPKPAAESGKRIEEQRRFTRYGYADYLREDRRYGVYYRIWPGTQRVLLWGDPAMAAGYGRYASFCGSLGLELCEPLSFKGRMGSGSPGGHEPYADASLRPPGGDWEKYLYSYRLWGRLLYDPNENPDTWHRFLRTEFDSAAKECEAALAHASRVLPLVTTAHHPSASNNRYWPEMYTDMPIVDAQRPHPYGDTPNPKRFGAVSSLDPALFSRIDDFVEEMIRGQNTGRYSPLDVATWLEGFARTAESHLERARAQITKPDSASFRRLAIDVKAQSGLGRFFAQKLRAGVAFALYERSGDRAALEEARQQLRAARDAWKTMVADTRGVYVNDLTFGQEAFLRGHWADRLATIEADLADMERLLQARHATSSGADGRSHTSSTTADPTAALLFHLPLRRPRCEHLPPTSFRRREPLIIETAIETGYKVKQMRLHYRHVNQAEDYRIEEMSFQGERYRQIIPGDYTDSPYPLMYFFDLRDNKGGAWLYPGFAPDLSNQPYFVVRVAKQ